jgi:hypothetical protein
VARAVGTDPGLHEEAQDRIVRGVLDVVERDPTITQRSVARELGIALGLANAYLRRCVRKGLIKVGQVPSRRYAYYLTPQGFAEKSRLTASYLANSFVLFRVVRTQCGQVFATAVARGQRRLALVGDGELAEIARLVALEHPVEITGTLVWKGDVAALSKELAALRDVDAVIVTVLADAADVFAAAFAAFGAERVHAPELLRLPAVAPPAEKRRAAP